LFRAAHGDTFEAQGRVEVPLVGGTGETAIWTVERTDHPDMHAESHQDPAILGG
jgi:hypothetical protein